MLFELLEKIRRLACIRIAGKVFCCGCLLSFRHKFCRCNRLPWCLHWSWSFRFPLLRWCDLHHYPRFVLHPVSWPYGRFVWLNILLEFWCCCFWRHGCVCVVGVMCEGCTSWRRNFTSRTKKKVTSRKKKSIRRVDLRIRYPCIYGTYIGPLFEVLQCLAIPSMELWFSLEKV